MDSMEITKRVIYILEKHGIKTNNEVITEVNSCLTCFMSKKNTQLKKPDILKRTQQFLAAKKVDGLSPRTIENYRYFLAMFANRINKNVTQISSDDLRQYIVFLSEVRNLKDSSIQTYLNTIKSFFSWMLIEGIIRRNPLAKIRFKRIDKKRIRQALSIEDLENLRNGCNSFREKALVEFLYSTGCRVSEVISIRVDTINFEDRSVRVMGKGGRERKVYFSVKAKLLLYEYLKRRNGGSYLFCGSRRPYNPLSTRAIQKIISAIGMRASIHRRVFPHILRHTFATLALYSGMDITVIQYLLGHADVGTTQIYAEVNPVNVKREHERYVA